ncbi:ATP-binding protein [Fibrella sp. ES10-3-2-2]|nr:hypothetical protein A6C57_25055 [Fibrella sp. ES10-3-2-2]
MLTDQTNDLSLAALLDVLPEGISWLKPMYSPSGELVNFQFIYVNGVIRTQSTLTNYKLEPGALFLDDTQVRPAYFAKHFWLLAEVLETGVSQTYTQFNDVLNGWYTITHQSMNGGILSVARDVSDQIQAAKAIQEQATQMQAMLEGSQNGTLLIQPVYTADQQPNDYVIVAANQAFGDLTNVNVKAVIGQSLGEVYPEYKRAGVFDLYCATLADGIPRKSEVYYGDSDRRGWFELSVSRHESYLVITSTNTTEARLARETIEEAARNLQSVIDHAQTGIFVFSPILNEAGDEIIDFRFKTINRMVAALVGQTPETLTGAVASDWFTSYRETGLFDQYRRTYLTGEELRADINYNVDGFDVWFDVQSRRVENDVLVTFTDYTLLKQAQQVVEQQAVKTRQQTELLNSVLDGSESGIMAFEAIRDPARQQAIVDFRFVVVNKACESIIGLPVESLLGKRLYDMFPGNWETGLFDLYVQTTESGQPGSTEVYYNHDGLDFWLSISTQKLGDGFVVTFSDISALKRATKAVEAASEELSTVIDTSQTGISLMSPVLNETGELVDFRFKVANKQLGAYVGQESATIIGDLASRWLPDYLTNGLFAHYREAYLTGVTKRFDFHYEGDGIDVWLDLMVTKMNDAVLVTFTDYTALKQLQQQLENTIADLKRSNANLEQFAYVASHDLQEPLRKIQSFGDVLQTRYGSLVGLDGIDLIVRMQIAANRMSGLIRDILAYSRLASRRDDAQLVSIQAVATRVLDDLDLTIQETEAVVQVGELPTVYGDEMQLRQLLQNLLSNALKFRSNERLPVISLSGHRVAAANLPDDVLPVQKAAFYECITLVDNGIGFDQKYTDRIFQVFQRLHGRSQYEGTGIGLAIVQKVVENHGGAVTASSQQGQGAVFTIYLPAV